MAGQRLKPTRRAALQPLLAACLSWAARPPQRCTHTQAVSDQPLKAVIAVETDGEYLALFGGDTARARRHAELLIGCERRRRAAAVLRLRTPHAVLVNASAAAAAAAVAAAAC